MVILVRQAIPAIRPNRIQSLSVPAPQKSDERIQEAGQDQLVDAVVAENGIETEPERNKDEPQGAQQLPQTSLPPNSFAIRHDEDQCGRTGQRRNDVHRKQRFSQQGAAERHQRRHQRRQIHVPERQVSAERDGVEFVAKKAVTGGDDTCAAQISPSRQG